MKLLGGLIRQAAGAGLKVTDDAVGSAWKGILGKLTKWTAPKGRGVSYNSKTGDMVYTPLTAAEKAKAGAHARFNDYIGRTYNKSRFLGDYAKRLNRKGRYLVTNSSDWARQHQLGKYTGYGTTGLSMAGFLTGLSDMGLEMAGMEDHPLHGVGSWNPFQWWHHSQYSPGNFLWSYTTPLGLGLTYGVPWAGEKLQNLVAGAANSTIDSTADALANLGMTERLAYLFDPAGVSNKYRSRAKSQLSSQMGLTGDQLKDNALQDVDRTLKVS